jgi:hypothetical protein
VKEMRTTCAFLLSLSLVFVIVAAGQTSSKSAAKAPKHHPWASFKPGSWVKIRSTSGAHVSETKTTLLEKTADKVVLENELTTNGQVTRTKFDLPLAGYTNDVPPGVTVIKRGSETLTVAGKSLVCEMLETEMDAGGAKIQSKTWSSDQVPGSLVKSVNTSSGRQSTAEVVDFNAA